MRGFPVFFFFSFSPKKPGSTFFPSPPFFNFPRSFPWILPPLFFRSGSYGSSFFYHDFPQVGVFFPHPHPGPLPLPLLPGLESFFFFFFFFFFRKKFGFLEPVKALCFLPVVVKYCPLLPFLFDQTPSGIRGDIDVGPLTRKPAAPWAVPSPFPFSLLPSATKPEPILGIILSQRQLLFFSFFGQS